MERKKYKHIHYRIDAGYEWGVGMTRDSVLFDKEMFKIFHEDGWTVTVSPEGCGSCAEARKHGQYLYCHPMDVSGYVWPENIEHIKELLSGRATFSLRVTDVLDDIVSVLNAKDEMRLYHETWDAVIEERMKNVLTTKRRDFFRHICDWWHDLWESLEIRTNLRYIGMSSGDTAEEYLKEKFNEFLNSGLIVQAEKNKDLYRWRSKYDK